MGSFKFDVKKIKFGQPLNRISQKAWRQGFYQFSELVFLETARCNSSIKMSIDTFSTKQNLVNYHLLFHSWHLIPANGKLMNRNFQNFHPCLNLFQKKLTFLKSPKLQLFHQSFNREIPSPVKRIWKKNIFDYGSSIEIFMDWKKNQKVWRV